jgi:hypothetical protein
MSDKYENEKILASLLPPLIYPIGLIGLLESLISFIKRTVNKNRSFYNLDKNIMLMVKDLNINNDNKDEILIN